jgi:cytoskeletal protein CcmA (bactofilin family)
MINPKTALDEKKTLVEEGTEFKGSLASSCPIEVKGAVEGEVSGPVLTVRSTGAVRGKVKVSQIHSEGEIAGEFDAEEVRLSGTVKDNTVIRAKSLEVRLASEGKMQVMFGECELEIGDAPTAQPSVRTPKESARAQPSATPAKAEGNGSVAPGPKEEQSA